MPLILGLNDAHLVGKLLDFMDDGLMRKVGFTESERERAAKMFGFLNLYLDAEVDPEWDAMEVL
jgi:hypothetical protein